MKFEDRFYDLLRMQGGKWGWQTALANKAGIPQNTLSRIASGEAKNPTIKNVGAIVDALGIESFLDRPVAAMHRMGENSPLEPVEGESLPRIPVYGSAGAGDPQEFWASEPEQTLEVLPQYVKPGLAALRIEGDSMSPTIKRGSVVGVCPLDGRIQEGCVYLVNVPHFGRVVKRIRISKDGEAIELVSDNPEYPPITIPIEQHEKLIAGRIVWVWQEI